MEITKMPDLRNGSKGRIRTRAHSIVSLAFYCIPYEYLWLCTVKSPLTWSQHDMGVHQMSAHVVTIILEVAIESCHSHSTRLHIRVIRYRGSSVSGPLCGISTLCLIHRAVSIALLMIQSGVNQTQRWRISRQPYQRSIHCHYSDWCRF